MPRSILLFLTLIPLAVILGVMLATPLDPTSLLVLGGCLLLLMVPFFLRSHHTILVVTINAAFIAFFLPGQPYFWMVAAGSSLLLSVLAKTLNRSSVQIYWVNSVALPLVLLAILVIITAKLTGGIGARAFGSTVYGGRRYAYIMAAIVAFFALCFKAVAAGQHQRLARWYILSGLTTFVGTVAYWLGPAFYFLFLLFPAEWVLQQAYADQMLNVSVRRIAGLSPAMWTISWFLLMAYGLKGILDLRRPWIGIFFISATLLGLLSGFRAYLLLIILVLFFQFFAEGLHRTKYLAISLFAMALFACVTVPIADSLPLAAQRCLTIFPIKLDPIAEADARASWEWRREMWKVAMLDIPQYFWIGKGYAINPNDMYLTFESARSGGSAAYEGSLLAGDYHNGPLSVQLPFGIFGSLLFLWFLGGSTHVLYRNFKYGDPSIKNINTFFLASFLARMVFFLFFFGALFTDLVTFTTTVALSISLNRGVRSAKDRQAETVLEETPSEEKAPNPIHQAPELAPV
jgi:hypothetical protein